MLQHNRNSIFISDLMSDGEENKKKYYLLLLRALISYDSFWSKDTLSYALYRLLKIIDSLPVDKILNVNSFFWFNLFKVWSQIENNQTLSLQELSCLKEVILASYPHLIDSNFNIISTSQLYTEAKQQDKYNIFFIKNYLEIKNCRYFFIKSDAGGCVIASNNSALFDDYAQKQIDLKFSLNVFAQQIEEAHKLIKCSCPKILIRLRKKIKWYVPLIVHDEQIHRSFTVEHQHGVIFLSPSFDSLKLAEAIVHELGHLHLSYILLGNPIFKQSPSIDNQIYYSPWRNDPRPLIALIHALYVYCEVLSFFDGLIFCEYLTKSQNDWLYKRRQIISFRLFLGIAQIPKYKLTFYGCDLLRLIEDHLNNFKNNMQDANNEVLKEIIRHANNWKNLNPSMQLKVPSNLKNILENI